LLLRAGAVRRLRHQSQHRRRPVRQRRARDLRTDRRSRLVCAGQLPRVVPGQHRAGHGSRCLSGQLSAAPLSRPRPGRRLGALSGERRQRRRAAVGRADAQLGTSRPALSGAHHPRGRRSGASLPHGPDRCRDGARAAVSRPAPLLPAWLRDELAARPGRWRQALVISSSAALSLGIVLVLQIASFPAPLITFKTLLPSIVCTWRNLFGRAVVIVGAALLVIPSVGVLVQVPWLLLPVFFVAISALTYIAPLEQYPVRGYCAALTVGAMAFTGIFAPYELPTTALSLSGGFLVGLLVATTISELRRTDHPHDRLSRELANAFTNARLHLREAGVRYRAESTEAPASIGSDPHVPLLPGVGDLARHLQLFDL